jgi:hypothetical protein
MSGEQLTHNPLKLSRTAAADFAERWRNATDEKQQAQHFWQDFFRDVCQIPDLRAAGIEFEKRVTSSKKGTTTFIDVFWKDTFLAEHKSAGKDLDAAEAQAREYVVSLPPALRPPVIILSDFARFRIVDVLLNKSVEFTLDKLPDELDRIEAIIGHRTSGLTNVQVEADQKAAQLMADLYVQLENNRYEGHHASVFMVRILFCLFADDTRMWQTGIFEKLVKDSNVLGTDLGARLAALFEMLDTPRDERPSFIDPFISPFPYVNGGIFSERLPVVYFNTEMRNALLNCCAYDWSGINPTIFGALFQDIKSKDERRANGEHYTTEANIDKTIRPLFIDELHAKLETAWDNEGKLKELQRELGTYQVLDPACGCGNFLITTYKRLRQLELDIIVRIKQLEGTLGQTSLLDVAEDLFVRLEQLHGIEYVEWSAQIAKVAIYLTDHQENLKLETVLGVAANRFPLAHAANIVQGNALQIDWSSVCPIGDRTVIVGNPPFLGTTWQSDEQKADQDRIWGGVSRSGALDYVTNWYLLAAEQIGSTKARAAFVSTNSVSQGQQAGIIWQELFSRGFEITFAHRTFVWESDASGKAAVHCVIIGFAYRPSKAARALYYYSHERGAPVLRMVKNINPYLLDAPNVIITARSKPISEGLQPITNGSKPTDDGLLSNLTPAEADAIRAIDPIAAKYLRPIMGAQEFISGKERFCLWLAEVDPADLVNSTELKRRVSEVKAMRSASAKATTRRDAATPYLFQEIRQPTTDFIAVPEVSSQGRDYVPIGFFSPYHVPTNKLKYVPLGDLWLFAVLNSSVFNIWVKSVSMRLKSDYSISTELTYNNFPLPELTASQIGELRLAGQSILDARAKHPGASLAILNNPDAMPTDLIKAHRANDSSVLKVFGLSSQASEDEIMLKLLTLYTQMATSGASLS